MTKDEAEKMLARSKQLLSIIEAADAAGDRETVRRLAGEYYREVGLPVFLPVIDIPPSDRLTNDQ